MNIERQTDRQTEIGRERERERERERPVQCLRMFADLSTRAVPDRLLALQAGSTLDRSARQPRTDRSRTLGTAVTVNVARRTIPSVTFRPLGNNLDSSPPSLLLLLLLLLSVTGVKYKLSVMVHRCLSGCAPQYLATYCVPVSSIAARQHLRSAVHQLAVPSHRLSTYGRRAFAIAGPTTWNSLPTHLRRVDNGTAAFGRLLLKTHLFSEY